jgi:hypothetical protein
MLLARLLTEGKLAVTGLELTKVSLP